MFHHFKGEVLTDLLLLLRSMSTDSYLIIRYEELANRLMEEGLCPAIVFIFSRKGCEQCASNIVNGKVRRI
jgi:superfamily II RNA helicase